MTTMSSLCTALDLLQNGRITSGIDMFLEVSGLCMMLQRFLVRTFMDKNFNCL